MASMMNSFFTQLTASLADRPALRRALWPALVLRRRWRTSKDAGVGEVLDRLADMLAEDPVLDVAEFEGRFAVSAKGHLFRRVVESGEYEPVLTRRCLELLDRQRDVIDVGANIGFHTVLFAKHLDHRRLLAIEPTRNALRRLRRNIALNGVESVVTVFEGVASRAPGWCDIKTVAGLEEYSSLGVMEHPSIAGVPFVTEKVEARTLDQLALEHGLDCGFVKVDVEGAERDVFEGGRHVFTRHRPVVVSELSDALLRKNGSSAVEIIRFFEALDYVVTDPLIPGGGAGLREFGDIICVPKEHARAHAT